DSPHKKVATTAIHFADNQTYYKKFLKNPFLQLSDAKGFHFSILHRGYGGYYPAKGQLLQCAGGLFSLQKEVDGTEDYRLTSETWRKKITSALWNNKEFRKDLLYLFRKKPVHTFWAALSMVGAESWPWQFR